jgi:hypothetical protein
MKVMRVIGITGSRTPPTKEQRKQLVRLLKTFKVSGLHHGDCVGFDEMAHAKAQKLGIPVIVHPPLNERYRAFCEGALTYHTPKEYGVRNTNIVKSCDVLIAGPSMPEDDAVRSGTWQAVRIARKMRKEIYIIVPNGTVTQEPGRKIKSPRFLFD